ncbi:MAG: twin-arginine translocase subunit TatC [Ignavibacteria bacterium]|jgi:sec-independent protein translocase protein TatC|nr:twin-arginine translocase subunit TatC [Ignavibacteria bacterium]
MSDINDAPLNDDNAPSSNNEEESNMSFLQHLTELRKRIILALVSIIIGCAATAFFISDLMRDVFLHPALSSGLSLQNLQPFGQPFLYFKVIAITGIIVAMPFVLYQFWLFIAPALYENEKKWISRATLFTSLSFLCGVVFSYFVLIPTMLTFAANFGSDLIENRIDVNEYFSFVSMILLAAGGLFELPMLSFILSKMQLITPKFLSKYRRHAILVILILAAVLTPTPDPVSQLIFAAPIFVLYEISILVSRLVYKNM